jgi:hypothetical protein
VIEKVIDCSGYNFYCPEDRTYVVFDPQSQEENDRLDALLGATQLWDAAIKERKRKMRASANYVEPFAELHPVGWTSCTGEIICVVLQGVFAKHSVAVQSRGVWFAVRSKVEAEDELHADLQARLDETEAYLQESLGSASM